MNTSKHEDGEQIILRRLCYLFFITITLSY